MLRTGRGRLRPFWSLVHEAVLRAVAGCLRREQTGAAAYASGSFGSGEPLYGISDVDLVLVLPGDPSRPGAVRAGARRRWERIRHRFPLLGRLFHLAVFEDNDLADAVRQPALTYGLDGSSGSPAEAACYRTVGTPEKTGLLEGPGLYGPMQEWRLVGGRDRLPPAPVYDAQRRRIAAWLQIQSWWRFTFRACVDPGEPSVPFLCVKLVAEPARIWLWLTGGERLFDRKEVLERALRSMPDEEHALRQALELYHELPRSPDPPLAETLPSFVRLSGRIARLLEEDVLGAGATDVRLTWGGPSELPEQPESDAKLRSLVAGGAGPELLPLADWRALVLSWVGDEAFAPLPADPGDPEFLGAAAHTGRTGAYPALRSDTLLVLPTADPPPGRGRLRAVQCAVTDPVSFALVAGERRASFPEVPGWCARDWARRALAEHRAWLAALPVDEEGTALATPLNAARAALFHESVEAGEPELPLTMAATVERLTSLYPEARAAAEDAYDCYRAWRVDGREPPRRVAAELHRLVLKLPGYTRADSPARGT
jgi:hypothetical protein